MLEKKLERQEKISKIYRWIVIILLFTSVDTILFGTNGNRFFLWIPRIIGLISVAAMCYVSKASVLCKRDVQKLLQVNLTLILILFSSCVVNDVSIETIISRLIPIMVAFTVTMYIRECQFFSFFDDFLFIISLVAVVTEVMAYLAPDLLMKMPTTVNTAGYVFSSFFVGGMLLTGNLGSEYIRSSSIFWEPGAFAFYLIIGIMYHFFSREKIDEKRVITYICCLVFTFSTTGYLVFGVLMIGYIISGRVKHNSKLINSVVVLSFAFLLLSLVVLKNSALYKFVFEKLSNGTSGATTRYSSFFNGLKVAFLHPLLGAGSNLDEYMRSFVISSKYSNGGLAITNTIVAQFASYGCIFGSLFLAGTIKFMKHWSSSFLLWLILVLAIVMGYMGERFYSFIPFVFMFYGFVSQKGDSNSESSVN